MGLIWLVTDTQDMTWWVDKEPGNSEVVSFIVPALLPHENPLGLLRISVPTPTERIQTRGGGSGWGSVQTQRTLGFFCAGGWSSS